MWNPFRNLPRKKSKLVHDSDSTSFHTKENSDDEVLSRVGSLSLYDKDDPKDGSYDDYKYRERDVDQHLLDRFERFPYLGGMTQRISEETNIPRREVIKTGKSRYQDQSSNKGRGIHAAHVIRAGEINPKLEENYWDAYNELKNFLGHTQNVPKRANEWHKIGGIVDRFQSEYLPQLHGIDFNKESPSTTDKTVLNHMKGKFLQLLETEMKSTTESEYKEELDRAKQSLLTDEKYSAESVYQRGRKGYIHESRYRMS